MSVSKRTRYEVMRRDNFTCRYCRSDENKLTIDHVVPVSLGGSDAPDNLVAACRDCNSGKSSSTIDSAQVPDVPGDAVRWAVARELVAEQMRRDRAARDQYTEMGLLKWEELGGPDNLPPDCMATLWKFYELGLPLEECEDAMYLTITNSRVHDWGAWRYFAGICWKKLDEIQVQTLAEARVSDELAAMFGEEGDDGS